MHMHMPSQVRLLEYDAFYWPPWNPWGIAQLYRTPRCLMPSSYAVHLWETKMWASLLGKLQPATVASRATCFTRIASAVLEGHFNISDAVVPQGSRADVETTLVYSRPLVDEFHAADTSMWRSAPQPLPASLAPFRGAQAERGRAAEPACADELDECVKWAESGECTTNPSFMLVRCKRSCKACAPGPK